jgi:Zn-dependent protease with chaperone function
MVFLGRWLFRLYLGALTLGVLLPWYAVMAVLERLMGWSRTPLLDRTRTMLMHKDAVVAPAFVASFWDDYEHPADGPGWSEAQIPRLWSTCRAIAQQLGCAPPDAIHLSVEPGDTMAWNSREPGKPVRRHICLSLLDLRLASHDEARAVIAHEITHAGFDHTQDSYEQFKHDKLMEAVADGVPFPLGIPVRIARFIHDAGVRRSPHAHEHEADRRAAAVVGGNHAAKALERILIHAPVLEGVFKFVLERAKNGPRAPMRLAEAVVKLYTSNDFSRVLRNSEKYSELDSASHPSLPARVENVTQEPDRTGIGAGRSFIEAYPELLAVEELLTKTYFPDTPQHTRSDASQLRRKALAARLKRR